MTINSGMNLSSTLFTHELHTVPIRDGFGEGLLLAGEQNEAVVVLTADLKESTRSQKFAEKFPSRFFDCGVAEQGMVTVASGMANSGKIPFVCSFAAFSPGRNWEQIRTTICINDVPVKIAGLFGGVSVGADGATHQMLEDIALMRVLPNMVVLAPADAVEARKAVVASVQTNRPVYIRVPRVESPVFTTDATPFEIGKANLLIEGSDLTIIACGAQVYTALEAARSMEQQGMSVEVLNLHTIKPLDAETILRSARKTQKVITIEDHQIAGGMGSAVAELLSEHFPIRLRRVGIQDEFGQSGAPAELYTHYGLTVENLLEVAHSF